LKIRYVHKSDMMDELRRSKGEVETVLQHKVEDLHECEEAVSFLLLNDITFIHNLNCTSIFVRSYD
jgi:hypothetical protein